MTNNPNLAKPRARGPCIQVIRPPPTGGAAPRGKPNTAKADTVATQREEEDHTDGHKAKKDKKLPNKTYARMVTGERKKFAK